MAPLWTFAKLTGSHGFEVISTIRGSLRRTQPSQSHDYRTEQRPLECLGCREMPRVVASAQPGQWGWKQGAHTCGIPRCLKGREFKNVSALPFSLHGVFHVMFTLLILSHSIYCLWEPWEGGHYCLHLTDEKAVSERRCYKSEQESRVQAFIPNHAALHMAVGKERLFHPRNSPLA